jgi:hypothetical protein
VKVTWKWWYPPGCIDGGYQSAYEFTHAPYDGEEAAAEIVQRFINENGTDGCKEFEIEILTPEEFAGVYDIALDWEPVTSATRRDEVEPSTPSSPPVTTEGE